MTPETRTLHHILSAVIITGASRNNTAAELKSQAEAAAAALRAGLSAFTAPAEPLTSGSVNASIPVTVNYGGAMEAAATTSHQRANRMAELVGIQNRSVGYGGAQLHSHDQDRGALTSLINRVIAEAIARVGRTSNIGDLAIEAVKAFENAVAAIATDAAAADLAPNNAARDEEAHMRAGRGSTKAV